MVVKQSTLFYSKVLQCRNDMLHNPEKHEDHTAKLHKNIIEMIEKSNKLEMKKHAWMQKIDVGQYNSMHVRYYNIQTMRVFSKAILELLNGIGQHFQIQLGR